MAAQTDNREFTEEESEEFSGLETEFKEIASQYGFFGYDNGGQRRTGANDPNKRRGIGPDPQQGTREPRSLSGASADRTWRGMFGQAATTGGFEDFQEFLSVIHSGVPDPRAMAMSAVYAGHGERVGSDGGFLVPAEFAAIILDRALEEEIVRQRAQNWPMASETLKIPGWDDSDNTGALYGGQRAHWVSEGGTIPESKGKLRQVKLVNKKLALFSMASNELLADSLGFDAAVIAKLVAAASWNLDVAFLTGTGAGQPQGMLTSGNTARIVVAKETNQATATIIYENIAKMFARLHPACMKNAVWVVNQMAIPQLLKLAVPTGISEHFVPVMSESDGTFRILTRPVIFTEKVPVLGSESDINLVDFSQYAVGMRSQVTLAKSEHVGFQQDETAYRAILRADGQSLWDKPVQPRNGDPLTWCVSLGARA